MLAVAVSSGFLVTWQSLCVSKARKAAGVPYPRVWVPDSGEFSDTSTESISLRVGEDVRRSVEPDTPPRSPRRRCFETILIADLFLLVQRPTRTSRLCASVSQGPSSSALRAVVSIDSFGAEVLEIAEPARGNLLIPCSSSDCAQRAHGNTLESLPFFLFSLLYVGLTKPVTAAILGALWMSGRVLYTIGYNTGIPKNRMWG